MARIAQLRGAVAIVTDGMARDADEIVALGIPCFCRGVTPNSAFRAARVRSACRSRWARW
jgi:regulator of RNase E activity RraA